MLYLVNRSILKDQIENEINNLEYNRVRLLQFGFIRLLKIIIIIMMDQKTHLSLTCLSNTIACLGKKRGKMRGLAKAKLFSLDLTDDYDYYDKRAVVGNEPKIIRK